MRAVRPLARRYVVNNNRYVFTGNGREFEGMGRFFGSVIRTDQASRNFSGYGNWNRWFEKKKESLENLPKVLKDAIKVGDVKKVAQGGLQSLKRSTDDAQKVAKGRARELSNGIKNSAAFKKLESNVDLGNKVKQVTDNTSRNLKFLTRQGLPGSKKVKEGVHLVKERVVSQFEKVKPEEVIRTVKKQGEQVAHATKGSMKKLEVASKKGGYRVGKKKSSAKPEQYEVVLVKLLVVRRIVRPSLLKKVLKRSSPVVAMPWKT
mmetsp:Transcript_12035/g.25880  ORF Transcript_12035/g.25880 Transcript_12035/m.25880 type:complete len:262 (-) Transcript_12035:2131-2916(-)